MAKAKSDVAVMATEASGHGRTPENTPIPGGGRWAWDDAGGAWVSLDPAPKTDEAQPE